MVLSFLRTITSRKNFNTLSSKIQPSIGNSAPVSADSTQDLHIAIVPTNIVATLRVNNFSIDIYDTASDTFIKNMLRELKSC